MPVGIIFLVYPFLILNDDESWPSNSNFDTRKPEGQATCQECYFSRYRLPLNSNFTCQMSSRIVVGGCLVMREP